MLDPSSAWFLIAQASMSLACSSRALASLVLGDEGRDDYCERLRLVNPTVMRPRQSVPCLPSGRNRPFKPGN